MADQTSAAAIRTDPEATRLLSIEEFGLRELEIVRLILRGGSVIDWRRAAFDRREQVDRFLKLHLVDTQQSADRALAYRILKEAVDYLRSTFHYRVADAVAEPYEIQDLLLFASGLHPRYPKRFQKIACIVLKVMHVIHHTESRELLYNSPIASSVLHRMVDERVSAVAAQLKRAGFPLVDFSGSFKTQNSVITKLLAKQDTVAAQVFDKVRYRIVTREKKDVLPVLEYLTRNLFPFNLVVPSQTENSLIDFPEVVEQTPALHRFIPDLHLPVNHDRPKAHAQNAHGTNNPFSSAGYRALNFVVDLPLRIDNYLPDGDSRLGRPRIVFSWVEFQIVDLATAVENERGENSHESYKQRQRVKVLKRLSRGLVVPRRPVRPSTPEEGGGSSEP